MYTRILVPVDGSPTSNRGLDEAVKLAKLTGAQLRLIHVVDEFASAVSFDFMGAMAADLIPLLREAGEKTLQTAKARVQALGASADTALFDNLAARVCDRVVAEAEQWPADLIVIGTHGRRGFRRALMGSDAEQIARLAPVPVLLVRASDAAVAAATPPAGPSVPA